MNHVIGSRFDGYLDIEHIRQLVTVRPEPVKDLGQYGSFGSQLLARRLEQIYLPNQFSLNFIHEMVGRAYLHHLETFASKVSYSTRIFDPPTFEVFPICFTGLAGVGKSKTLEALMKALPPPVEYSCGLFQGQIELKPFWYASARGKKSGKQILVDFVVASGGNRVKANRATLTELLTECRSIATRDGVTFLFLDEMQFITPGEGGSKVTDILINTAGIGLPMVFASNYSLVHKLLARNSEDTQRLLAEPRIMLPDDPLSQDWSDYVDECIRVSCDRVDADRQEFAAELYRSTAGLKRLVVQLFKLAYMQCQIAGRDRIRLDDLYNAYRSTFYKVSAKQVQKLEKLALNSDLVGKDLDLKCPFDSPSDFKTNILSFSNAKRAQEVQNNVIDSALTPDERLALKQISEEVLPSPSPMRRGSAPKASVQDLGRNFGKYVAAVPPTTKPK